ncbi:hypothetical protein ABZ348_30985 [Streptomyces sp. NPDC005963]|uniref:phage tail tube protein n=1 Tax=Streptomyces sp. NPDC005963 TaxID=3156721 RepID=UPI0033F495B2
MTLNDAATLVIGSGNYLTAPVGTDLPSDLLAPLSPWASVGHTSLEDILSISSEGGEATTIGTLQNKSLRTKYSTRVEVIAFTLQQFDVKGLRLYYGANAPLLSNGLVGVPNEPVPTSCAFLSIFVDGENVFAIYAPKSEIYRADDLSIGDTESLAGLPLGVKPMAHGANNWTYAITPLGTVSALGATAGIPGAFTPSGSLVPANLAGLDLITASPTTAWSAGQYVVLGDNSNAHWNGTDWITGIAS